MDYVGDHDQIERPLLQAGAEPYIYEDDEEDDSKISEEDGSSSTEEGNALVAAAVKGDVGEIRRLVDLGTSANARNFSGNAPIHLASAYGGGEVPPRFGCRRQRQGPRRLYATCRG